MLLALVPDDARLRIGDLAAARQPQEQECAGALEGDGAAADDPATLAYRSPGGAIDVVPELYDRRMRSTPFAS